VSKRYYYRKKILCPKILSIEDVYKPSIMAKLIIIIKGNYYSFNIYQRDGNEWKK